MRDNLFVIPATFHIFKQEKFEDKTILVDGKTFIDCDFKNCTMQYGGGSGTVFDANRFDGYRWQFVGPALMTLGFMRSLYHGGFSTVIDEIVDSIRKTETK
jgi:hypothetical protein